MSTLFGVAVTYSLLHANFLAVVQVVVYIGAIAILFIFAVMLTRKDMRDQGPQMNRNWWVGAIAGRADLRRAVLPASELERHVERWQQTSRPGLMR